MPTRRKTRQAAPKPTRAVCYVRISVDRENETSTETQEERARAYCTAQGWSVVDVIVEPGRSAYKISYKDRPAFRRVLDLTGSRTADVVVVWKLDRACRDVIDTRNLVDELAEHGAQFVSVTEGFDTSTATGRMILTVLAALAEMESATKSERVQVWQDKRIADGATPTGPRPFGYRRERNRLVIDEDEACMVRWAADQILGGRSLKALTCDLEQKGVLGKNGKPITRRGVAMILTRPTIAGCRETSPGTFVESSQWPAILDREKWDEVRAILNDPARRVSPGSARRWLLSGIARCGRCETPMTSSTHQHGPRYTCPRCQLSIDARRTDEVVQGDLLDTLTAKAWRKLRQGPTPEVLDAAELESAVQALTRQLLAEEIDEVEFGELLRSLRRQSRPDIVPPRLPDVGNLKQAWPKFTLEQRRLVISTATETLCVMPWRPFRGFDADRIKWTPAF